AAAGVGESAGTSEVAGLGTGAGPADGLAPADPPPPGGALNGPRTTVLFAGLLSGTPCCGVSVTTSLSARQFGDLSTNWTAKTAFGPGWALSRFCDEQVSVD